ncbi:ATP-binding cassette domain-containing protein [Fusibacter bizertensis]|uniref:ATP-binding cassette domain-containing protein n=1 Tax=Fusibacter bizertensis TaxID=1488331 RepID=A0ABT6N9A9_9FIRM|nr:ATP-binding cassette domain-containing protein [Fusibacter bizertensis]MDH8676992.1 ATP-binding cassette domain-containing protein [Fusibacter bizertensis]
MIKVDNLSYGFPQKDLYNKISFALEDGQHCAFIGTSGSGKSTLVDIIMDPERYMYDGKLEIDPQCRIGYISQFLQVNKNNQTTVFDYIAERFLKLQAEIDKICTEMETSPEIDTLLEKYQQVLDDFEAIDGHDYVSNINKKLNLAGLYKHKDLGVSELSGGEFKLIQVIKEMLISPNLLIMDEPDVFLDFENLNALKNLINAHKGILLVITHNRYLLNHCFNKIIHLENMELQEFNGSFIEYNFTLLQRKIELQELAIADTEEIARNEYLIDRLRFIATNNSEASRGKALKARVKIQERLEANRIKEPFVAIKQPDIKLDVDMPIGGHKSHEVIQDGYEVIEIEAIEPDENDLYALRVSNYSASYDELLLENVNFEILPTDKVALIGANGTGKTTLLRDIYKNNRPEIDIHETAKVGYLSQFQGESLEESNTVAEEFFEAGFNSYSEIRAHISLYGFNEEILTHKISALSGGERNILQLAKISALKANFLLLDEPTSHLDTYSQLALEKAIADYKGAILMISHDYYTIINCMDYVLIIEDRTIRKMSIRKFRKMIYESHFDKDYLELEQKKKQVETKIELALKDTDFELAKVLSEDLEAIVSLL